MHYHLNSAMKRSLIVLIGLVVATIGLEAQEGPAALDTLYGSKRDVVTAKVTSIANGKVHIKRSDNKQVIPFSDVDAIRFADGFRLDFRDGVLLRDNVLSAPSYDESPIRVKVEGVLALTPEEIQSFYGSGYYDVVYRPYRTQTLTGFGKLGVGILGSLISFPQARWGSGHMESVPTEGLDKMKWPKRYTETTTYDPFWMASSMFFMGMTLTGIADIAIPYFGFHNSLRKPVEERPLPTAASSKGLIWGGAALSVLGIGGFAASCVELKSRPSRSTEITLPHSQPWPVLKTEIPWVVFTMAGSALVANLGFSAIQLGASRLSALRRLDGTPYALQVNIGPSPSGYGLTMQF